MTWVVSFSIFEQPRRTQVEEHGAKRSWQKISEALGSGRTASGVEQHWQVMTGQRQRNGATVPKENQAQHPNALLAVGQKDGQQTERRTSARWTQDEENRLRDAVSELGKGKWTLVDLGVPSCCGGFTSFKRVVSGRGGRGWSLFRFRGRSDRVVPHRSPIDSVRVEARRRWSSTGRS